MRPTPARLAHAVSAPVHAARAQLLPPVPLLRRLLRAHRALPPDMRSLGDAYVKAEFRRHRAAASPQHVVGFLAQWKRYLEQLPARGGGTAFAGRRLDAAALEKMSEAQIAQLYELMRATKDVWKPAAAAAGTGTPRRE